MLYAIIPQLKKKKSSQCVKECDLMLLTAGSCSNSFVMSTRVQDWHGLNIVEQCGVKSQAPAFGLGK